MAREIVQGEKALASRLRNTFDSKLFGIEIVINNILANNLEEALEKKKVEKGGKAAPFYQMDSSLMTLRNFQNIQVMG